MGETAPTPTSATPADPSAGSATRDGHECRPPSRAAILRSRANHPASPPSIMRHVRVMGLVGSENRCAHRRRARQS